MEEGLGPQELRDEMENPLTRGQKDDTRLTEMHKSNFGYEL